MIYCWLTGFQSRSVRFLSQYLTLLVINLALGKWERGKIKRKLPSFFDAVILRLANNTRVHWQSCLLIDDGRKSSSKNFDK